MYNIVVLLKGSNIQKTISLPRYSSLWKLRQVINQEFNLDNTNFEMYYPKIQGAYDMSR